MSTHPPATPYGAFTEPATLNIQRMLPGPVERIWSYLTVGELRSQWLAAGDMDLRVSSQFELVWRNDRLSHGNFKRPEGFPEESRMQSRVIAADPFRLLVITWGESGEVSITLEPRGSEVLLTLVHQRVGDRSMQSLVGAGWHMHLDILVARLAGTALPSFWNGWLKLHADYVARLSNSAA
jgi:uncharacterized protein YndB with AHSA1/START domain